MSTSVTNKQPPAFKNVSAEQSRELAILKLWDFDKKKGVVVFIKLCFRILFTFLLTKSFHLLLVAAASDRMHFLKIQT